MTTILLLLGCVAWGIAWGKWVQFWPTWAHVVINVATTVSLYVMGAVGLAYFLTGWLLLTALVAIRERRVRVERA